MKSGLRAMVEKCGRLRRAYLLIRRHNMAGRAPGLGQRFTFARVGGQGVRFQGSDNDQRK